MLGDGRRRVLPAEPITPPREAGAAPRRDLSDELRAPRRAVGAGFGSRLSEGQSEARGSAQDVPTLRHGGLDLYTLKRPYAAAPVTPSAENGPAAAEIQVRRGRPEVASVGDQSARRALDLDSLSRPAVAHPYATGESKPKAKLDLLTLHRPYAAQAKPLGDSVAPVEAGESSDSAAKSKPAVQINLYKLNRPHAAQPQPPAESKTTGDPVRAESRVDSRWSGGIRTIPSAINRPAGGGGGIERAAVEATPRPDVLALWRPAAAAGIPAAAPEPLMIGPKKRVSCAAADISDESATRARDARTDGAAAPSLLQKLASPACFVLSPALPLAK